MKNNKITICYFGSAFLCEYQTKTTTVTQFKKWRQQRHKNVRDVAFILQGTHNNINSYELEKYLTVNNLQKLSIYDF